MSNQLPSKIIPLSEADNETKTNLTQTKMAMLLQYPFFACLMLDMLKVKITDDIPTMGVDTHNIYINPKFFNELTLQGRIFGMCHEISHAMWMHMSRGKKYMDIGYNGQRFQPFIFNCAADFVINDLLIKGKIGEPMEGILHSPKYNYKQSVEEVYEDLIKDAKQQGKGAGDQDEDAGMDTHFMQGEPDGTRKMQWERAIKSARDATKLQGFETGMYDELIEKYFTPVVDWRDKVKAQVRKIVGVEEADWSRPNRHKLLYPGIYTPRRKGYALDHVVIAMDTSGSVSLEAARRFYSEASALFSEYRPYRLTLIYCDYVIKEVRELFDPSELESNNPQPFKGRGGTSFIPPFVHMAEQEMHPDVMVYMTDLCGDFPEKPTYPVIWLSVSAGVTAPFGMTIEVPERGDDA